MKPENNFFMNKSKICKVEISPDPRQKNFRVSRCLRKAQICLRSIVYSNGVKCEGSN